MSHAGRILLFADTFWKLFKETLKSLWNTSVMNYVSLKTFVHHNGLYNFYMKESIQEHEAATTCDVAKMINFCYRARPSLTTGIMHKQLYTSVCHILYGSKWTSAQKCNIYLLLP
jgi:hypothetical protein